MQLANLIVEWQIAKNQERDAIERRRAIEDRIKALAGIDEASERTHVLPVPGGGALRVITKLDRKVDAALLRLLARERGLQAEVERYFRWKAEVNLVEWRKAPAEITLAFSPAITTKPARASFTLDGKEKGEER